MSNQPCRLTLALILFSASALLAPRAGFASMVADGRGTPEQAPDVANRLQWTIETADSVGTHVEVRHGISSRVIAYRFRVDVNEMRADDASIAAMAWDAEVRLMHADDVGVLHLTDKMPEQTLPLPFGVQLMAGDTVIVTVTFAERGHHAVRIRVTIDHEVTDRKSMRLPSQACRVDPGSTEGGLVSTWEWKNPIDGELWAVSGALREYAAGMRLTDVTTGEDIWSDGPSGDPRHASTVSTVQRFGVSVVAGHTYRLTIVRKHDAHGAMVALGAGRASATAIVVPNLQ